MTKSSVNGEVRSAVIVVTESGEILRDGLSPSSNSVSSPKAAEATYSEQRTPHDKPMVEKSRRIKERVVYTVSLVTLLVLAYCVVSLQWFLPYYYAVTAPILLTIRVVQYWKFKWQYFLLDFCYFGNLLTYVYMWALPWQREVSMVIFGLANGPLAWATVIFRNSLVLHSMDKMTSVYIHVLPLLISYGVRWYPAIMSRHWYTAFSSEVSNDVGEMFIWLAAVPIVCFILHAVLYALLVYVVFRPSEQYLNSYRYLSSSGWTAKVLRCCGDKYSPAIYNVLQLTYCAASLLLCPLWYSFIIAHSIYLAIIMITVTWHGAGFYTYLLNVAPETLPSKNSNSSIQPVVSEDEASY